MPKFPCVEAHSYTGAREVSEVLQSVAVQTFSSENNLGTLQEALQKQGFVKVDVPNLELHERVLPDKAQQHPLPDC